MRIKAGDTAPDLTADLNADVTGATVTYRIMKLNRVFAATGTVTVDNAATGLVRIPGSALAALAVGGYYVEFRVVYAGGAIQRFPQGSYLELMVKPAAPAA